MNDKVRTHTFKAEVQEVLNLVAHSLYSHKEIFLRELVSNASDACDKLRFEALRDSTLAEAAADLRIEIEVDREQRLLTIRDSGIGMSREEVAQNIGTIAHSGTRRFLEQAGGGEPTDLQQIGQFGVGFYSAFIVADHVTLLTRRAGAPAEEGVRWESGGSGKYRLGNAELPRHGTEVILHLKESETEFLQDWTLRSLVRRYSDHIGFPIRLREPDPDAEDGGEPAWRWATVNQAAALWTLPRQDIDDEAYQSFYQHVTHDNEDALAWAHNRVEGSHNYTSLLYLPAHAPLDLMLQRDERRGLKLYVRRVFIMDAAEQLLPHYLRFMRGVVDSDDLPLNVSRELLQDNELVGKIRAAVVRRSLDLLARLAKDEPETYAKFWAQFGEVLKEGMVEDPANRERIAPLLRFTSTHDREAGDVVGLADYIERMPEGQEAIWFITAESLAAAANSPHLEVFRKRGIEVLLLHDRIDEWMMGYFSEFDGKPLRSVAKGEVDLGPAANEAPEETAELPGDLAGRMQEVLGEAVESVRASHRLTESAACLVLAKHDMALHLRRLLEQAGQPLPASRPVLEINPTHPLIQRLEGTGSEEDFADLTHLVHEQAVLAEGGQLEDPAAFVRRLNRLILATGD